MADDPYARIAQLEAEVAALREREATLTHEVEHLRPALAESLEQQTATAEILRVIASSPRDVQLVLDAVVRSAARLGEADTAATYRLEGDRLRIAACTIPEFVGDITMFAGSVNGRVMQERRTIHVFESREEHLQTYPNSLLFDYGNRAEVVTPLLSAGDAIGTLVILRRESRPFSERQIALLETF